MEGLRAIDLHYGVVLLKLYALPLQREVEENHKGENKRLMAAPTLEALLFTTNNYVALAEQLLLSGKRVCFRVFTQDVLEAFFGDLVS